MRQYAVYDREREKIVENSVSYDRRACAKICDELREKVRDWNKFALLAREVQPWELDIG